MNLIILGGETQPTPGNEAQPGMFFFLLIDNIFQIYI